jgi:hypothetical protein
LFPLFRHKGIAVEVQEGFELQRRLRYVVLHPEPVEKLIG